jgi:hypothetical protein
MMSPGSNVSAIKPSEWGDHLRRLDADMLMFCGPSSHGVLLVFLLPRATSNQSIELAAMEPCGAKDADAADVLAADHR